MDVRAIGSWMSSPEMLVFSLIFRALNEVLGRDICANDPLMSAGCPSQKLPLWADCRSGTSVSLHPLPQTLLSFALVNFSSSHRAQVPQKNRSAQKVGGPANSRKSAQSAQNYMFGTKKSASFAYFLEMFLASAEAPLFSD